MEADLAADRASSKLMRDALGNYGLNNFENSLNAVEEFLCKLELFDPDIGFGQAAEALATAASAFALIDANHDQRLSHQELQAYSSLLDNRTRQLIEWIQFHYDAIQRAGFGHSVKGISHCDLDQATNFFRGLEFTHVNFHEIANRHDAIKPTLTHHDIDRYLASKSEQIDTKSRNGLISLALYLRNLEVHGHPQGLAKEEVDHLSAEDLWTG